MIKAIIFGYGRTIANSENTTLYPEVPKVLDALLEKGFALALVSRAEDTQRRWEDFENLHLNKYFRVMDVVDKNSTKEFRSILMKLKVQPNECLIVGDRVKSEIIEGNKLGITTIWLRQGKFADELPEFKIEEPSFTISSLDAILKIVEKL